MMAGFKGHKEGVIVNLSIQINQEGVTISGKPSDELAKGTQMSILKQAGLRGSEHP
jgi:hypothetical protein